MANLQGPGEDLGTLHVFSPPPVGWRYHAVDQRILGDNDRLIQDRPTTVHVDLGHQAVAGPSKARSGRESWKD